MDDLIGVWGGIVALVSASNGSYDIGIEAVTDHCLNMTVARVLVSRLLGSLFSGEEVYRETDPAACILVMLTPVQTSMLPLASTLFAGVGSPPAQTPHWDKRHYLPWLFSGLKWLQ